MYCIVPYGTTHNPQHTTHSPIHLIYPFGIHIIVGTADDQEGIKGKKVNTIIMARHLARIHGTEEDKVRSGFYPACIICRYLARGTTYLVW